MISISAIVYAFNVDVLKDAEENANQSKIVIKQHNIIYKMIDDIKDEMNNSLPPIEVEDVQGNPRLISLYVHSCERWLIHIIFDTKGEASVLEEFLISENKKKIPVAGCRCISGTLKKAALFKVVREPDEVLYRGITISFIYL